MGLKCCKNRHFPDWDGMQELDINMTLHSEDGQVKILVEMDP